MLPSSQRDNFSPYKPRIYAVWGIQITFLVFNWSLLKSYVKPTEHGKSIEDFSSLLIDLNLISESHKEHRRFKFNYNNRTTLAPEVALFIILDNFEKENIIDFHSLSNLFFSLCITSEDLISILEDIKEKYSDIVFSDDSGIRQIQLRSEINKWELLEDYYNSIYN